MIFNKLMSTYMKVYMQNTHSDPTADREVVPFIG